jgi:hypothetical protein
VGDAIGKVLADGVDRKLGNLPGEVVLEAFGTAWEQRF